MKTEFALAFNEVLEDKNLPREVVMEALESAMVSAYRKSVKASTAQHIEAKLDPETGKATIYAEKEVVEDVQDERTEVTLEDARKVNPDAELGDMVIVESTPDNFGRVAAQTARQVIQQRIREAERETQYNYYIKQVGEIVNGIVQAVNPQGVTLGLEMKAEGLMPRSQMLPREFFRVHDRVRALLLEIRTGNRGPQIILSRAHRDFLRRLLENEVPEIYHGMVELRSIAREPGFRSKVAVAALQPGVDPVGACVGIRGVRIQAIVRELNDEKIDVIEWNPDPSAFIAKALSPARVTGVYLDDSNEGPKTATVVVPEDQLSLAIGRDGQNARLAAKLTGWRIDIKSLPEATSDVLFKLQNNPEYRTLAVQEAELVPTVENILEKKAEGRPIPPEEYHLMGSFVDRVERSVLEKRKAIKREWEARLKHAQESVPKAAYELPIETLGLSESVQQKLLNAEYDNVGDLMLQMYVDAEKIREISGIGPKAMQSIEDAIEALTSIMPADEEPEPEPEAIAEETEEPIGEEEAPAPEAEQPSEPEAAPEEEEEQPQSMEELFTIQPDMLDVDALIAEELEEKAPAATKSRGGKKKKKKPRKFVDVEYDPDQDVMLYRKRHKKDGDEWAEDDWDL
ncbi:MAG TPA: transcription termination/antitermination protein NusA [Anaerolineales bacterium]|nr:transcription termination/antitermination protein NusA [Anaerolineales bacterium]